MGVTRMFTVRLRIELRAEYAQSSGLGLFSACGGPACEHGRGRGCAQLRASAW
jgi:hypothetical protein